MGEKKTERVGIPLTTEMLDEIRRRAAKRKSKILDQIRYLIALGLEAEEKRAGLEAQVALLTERLDRLEADQQARGSPRQNHG